MVLIILSFCSSFCMYCSDFVPQQIPIIGQSISFPSTNVKGTQLLMDVPNKKPLFLLLSLLGAPTSGKSQRISMIPLWQQGWFTWLIDMDYIPKSTDERIDIAAEPHCFIGPLGIKAVLWGYWIYRCNRGQGHLIFFMSGLLCSLPRRDVHIESCLSLS